MSQSCAFMGGSANVRPLSYIRNPSTAWKISFPLFATSLKRIPGQRETECLLLILVVDLMMV